VRAIGMPLPLGSGASTPGTGVVKKLNRKEPFPFSSKNKNGGSELLDLPTPTESARTGVTTTPASRRTSRNNRALEKLSFAAIAISSFIVRFLSSELFSEAIGVFYLGGKYFERPRKASKFSKWHT
jgi:hypothetical protein